MAEETDPASESSNLDKTGNPNFDDSIASQARSNNASGEVNKKKSTQVNTTDLISQLKKRSFGNVDINFLLNIKLEMTFEVGRSKLKVSDLLCLGQGSVIELHRLVGEDLDLLVNGHVFAKGEVVVIHEKFGVRLIEILDPEERVKIMGL